MSPFKDESGVSDDGTGKEVHKRDWVCMDCGIVYCADADASSWDLPDYCPDCGDHLGWKHKYDGRTKT